MALPDWYIALFFVMPAIFTVIGIRRHLKTKRERKQLREAKKSNRKGLS